MFSQEDRLSALPDDLILHILSSLELKQVIATSILSPTVEVPLDLRPQPRPRRMGFSRGKYTPQSICLSLAQFNSPKIGKFSACFSLHVPKDFEIDMWIILAVDRSVEEVDLILDRYFGRNSVPYKVVGCLLDCGSLEVLKLSGCDLNLQASPLCFPLLKLLDLNHVNFSTLDTSGCPLLERLILKQCNSGEPLDIYAPNKKLWYLEIYDDYAESYEAVTIFAPYVCSILLEGFLRWAYDIKELSYLRTATLKYGNAYTGMHPDVEPLVQLLQSVFRASALELSNACVEV